MKILTCGSVADQSRSFCRLPHLSSWALDELGTARTGLLALVFAVGAAAGCYRLRSCRSPSTAPLILAPASLAGVTDAAGVPGDLLRHPRRSRASLPDDRPATRLSFA